MSALAIIAILVGTPPCCGVRGGAIVADEAENPRQGRPTSGQVRSGRRQEEREERGRRIAQGEKPRDVDASLKRRRQR